MAKTILIILIILLAIWGVYLVVNDARNQQNYGNSNANAFKNEAEKVSIENFSFKPATITIPLGKTVTWTNNDPTNHSVNSANFNSNHLKPGETFSFTANKRGVYNYTCDIHPFMSGKITVK